MIADQLIFEAQKAWGEGIIKIGKVFLDKGDYKAAAEDHIDEFYNYQDGQVLFKPTLAAQKQFRLDFDGALSYFGRQFAGRASAPKSPATWESPWATTISHRTKVERT